jgi:replicative DNA helicase Mcm
MSISEEILKLIENGITDWDEVYDILQKKYLKSSISMAKNRLIKTGKITEETINGKKILSINIMDINPNEDLTSDVEYLLEHQHEIKEYFKHIILDNPHNKTFNIKEFCLIYPQLAEINDIIISNPLDAREILTKLYKETYEQYTTEVSNIHQINITNPLNARKKLSEIGANDINKLVEFEGSIIQASKNMPRTHTAQYLCMNCGTMKTVKLDFWENPERKKITCPNPRCSNEKMALNTKDEINFQELIVQQLEVSPDGKQHTGTAFVEDLSEPIFSGKYVFTVVPIMKYKKNSSVADIFLYIVGMKSIDNIDLNITDEDIKNIHKIAEDPKVIEKISNYMFRDTVGMEEVKKAIFLQQIKGVKKEHYKRHNINILLITDPGIGKSTLMYQLQKYPNVKYASMSNASKAGLAGGLVKEKTEFGESWTIKAGLYPQADGGTVCLDEITHNKEVQECIHDVMESQKVFITKVNTTISLPAECATLAACNPKFGRFDPNLSIPEQINLPSPLLSRFDLIFPLRDIPNKKSDKELALQILKRGNDKIKGIERREYINGVELSDELISKYLIYANENYRPYLSDEAMELISEFYSEMRSLSKEGITITSRQLESISRIAEAIAKAKLKDVVEKEDAKEAIDLITYCLKQTAQDPECGALDVDRIYGIPASKRGKTRQILDIIESESKNNELVKEDIIIETAKEKYNIPEEEVERILELLKIRGDIYSPRFGYWKLL